MSDVTPFDWNAFSGGFGAPADVDGDGIEGEEFVPTGFNLAAVGGDDTRTSVFGALQWKTDSVDVNFDILASSLETDFNEHGMNYIGLTGASGTLVDPVVTQREVEGTVIDEYGEATITIPGTNASGFGSAVAARHTTRTRIPNPTWSAPG